ncbi:MAG TPA: DUF983 domain-containing protein [Trueperaceae bacterium]
MPVVDRPKRLGLPTVLRSALVGHCPNCVLGSLFRGFLRPRRCCDVCGITFEADSSTWLGTAFLMYLLASVLLIGEGVGLALLFGFFPGFTAVMGVSAVMLILFSYRSARGLWVWCLWKVGYLGECREASGPRVEAAEKHG